MSDIKLFRTDNGIVEELKGTSVQLEKSLQTLIEQNLEAFLGIRFLASEHSTGKTHGGRIDTLGIDEHRCPVIIEYKRSVNENVINQGLYYLNWLMDHKAEYQILVMKRYGQEQANAIQWAVPRLLCIAREFTKFDEHAVQQMNRNIELIRYRRYADGYLLLELLNAVSTVTNPDHHAPGNEVPQTGKGDNGDDYLEKRMKQANPNLRDCFEALRAFLLALGDDVGMRVLTDYVAFTRIKTLAYVHIRPRAENIFVDTKIAPEIATLEPGFAEDVGSGFVRIIMETTTDVEKAKPILQAAYESG